MSIGECDHVLEWKIKKYPEPIIQAAYDRAMTLTQKQCILPKQDTKQKTKSSMKPSFQQAFITTFTQDHNRINKILTKNWHILRSDPYLQDFLSSRPNVIYRRDKTLKQF